MTPTPFAPGTFTWALGIEDTCVYPPDGGTILDEHVLTDHVLFRDADLRTAAALGATALRYGMSWPVTNPALGVYDWSAIDPVVDLAESLGITLIADLVHYGTPTWLTDSFADPGYPDAIAAFAGALAERFAGRLTCFTPLNEPVTTASFCGLRGVWPPYLTGRQGWVDVVVPMAVGMVRTVAAIRAAQPGASIVHVEATTDITTADPELTDHAEVLRAIGWLPTDLVLGRVDAAHPLRGWLEEHGADPGHLAELESSATRIDVMGVNYYPDLTPRDLVAGPDSPVQVSYDRGTAGLRAAVERFTDRYRLPVVITETSIEGSDEGRVAWLRDSVAEIEALRSEGRDVRGYTWWPMFDFVDWSFASGGRNVEEFAVATADRNGRLEVAPAPPLGAPEDGRTPFLRRMGLLRLEENRDGVLARQTTPAAEDYARLAGGWLPNLLPAQEDRS